MHKRAVDYEGSYLIHVMDRDICEAVPGDPHNCAIAKAVKREHPEITYIRVGHGTISFTDREMRKRVTLRTSIKAQDAQDRLDSGLPVRSEDFPPIRINMDEAKIEPIEFNEHKRVMQNKRRQDVKQGKRVVRPMSEVEKDKRRRTRRHA